MAIDGTRSRFPCLIDDWGSEFEDNVCQKATAARWNQIQDALFRCEEHSLRVMLTGEQGVLTHAVEGANRPAILFKSYTVQATGSSTVTKVFQLGPFTAAEKALFGGTPLASGNSIHLQIRRTQLSSSVKAYHASLRPVTDPTGDSPWYVAASTLRHGNGDEEIAPGTYVISLMITDQ